MKQKNIKIFVAGVFAAFLLSLTACSTVKGFGKDVESLGDEIQDASN